MNKPMSKKSATILGSILWIFGAALIFMTVGQIDGVHAASIIVGAGCVWIGTWVSTVANAMKESDGQEPDESLADT
ncbi:MAG: hypothetical protein KY475_22665 [Planctomycetes bacterium]|nr:hypothetical protein [Planctomycetota bacterium]